MLLGTLGYMPPEHAEARTVDAKTDLFTLGMVLCEMATGQKVFEGVGKASLAAAIIACESPSPECSVEDSKLH
jgi:serine/threonine protein kinase